MKHIPKHNIYEVPERYFDDLSERIIHKKRILRRQRWYTQIAAAALLIIGTVVFISIKDPVMNEITLQAEMDQEVELYINSGYWDEEDVLILSENPDELLDAIIAEEWSGDSIKEDETEEEFW
jgi:predicted HNH restriction endonuclease